MNPNPVPAGNTGSQKQGEEAGCKGPEVPAVGGHTASRISSGATVVVLWGSWEGHSAISGQHFSHCFPQAGLFFILFGSRHTCCPLSNRWLRNSLAGCLLVPLLPASLEPSPCLLHPGTHNSQKLHLRRVLGYHQHTGPGSHCLPQEPTFPLSLPPSFYPSLLPSFPVLLPSSRISL